MICTLCKKAEASKSWCAACRKQYMRDYKNSNKAHLKALNDGWTYRNREHLRNVKRNYTHTPFGRCLDLVKSARRRAERRHIPFNLSADSLLNLWDTQGGKCRLTSIPFVLDPNTKGANPLSPSIDRIDAREGYLIENVRLVCYGVNCCLHDFGENVFRVLAEYRVRGGLGVDVPYVDNSPKTQLTRKQELDTRYRESFKGTVTALYRAAVRHAAERKVSLGVNKDHVREMLRRDPTCAVTGIPFDFSIKHTCSANPFRPSLDRIDSNKGYEQGNIRLVCVSVNFALNEFGDDTFHMLCERYLLNLNAELRPSPISQESV